MTKQSETRERVLDLIERLGVGEAIPSERQLSAEARVSRLSPFVRLSTTLSVKGFSSAGGAGTFVSAEDRAGADDDVVHRGHAAARDGARRARPWS